MLKGISFSVAVQKNEKRNKFFTLQEVSNCKGGVVLCFTVDRDELKVGSPSNISTKMHARKSRVHPLFLLLSSHLQQSESSFDVQQFGKTCPNFASQSLQPVKLVRFSLDIQSQDVPHRNDMSEREKKLLWYRTSDYKRIRREGQETVAKIRSGELCQDTNQHCLLGLDSEMHAYARSRSLHKLMLLALVLEEQGRQKEEGINDPELLAQLVEDFCKRCRHASFVAGLRDDRMFRYGVIN